MRSWLPLGYARCDSRATRSLQNGDLSGADSDSLYCTNYQLRGTGIGGLSTFAAKVVLIRLSRLVRSLALFRKGEGQGEGLFRPSQKSIDPVLYGRSYYRRHECD